MSAARYYNLEKLTIDEQNSLAHDLARLKEVSSGVCIPAGYHRMYDRFSDRYEIFELSHDLHYMSYLQLTQLSKDRSTQQKLWHLLLQPEHNGKFFPANTCIVADYSPSERRQYYVILLSHAIMVSRNSYGEMTAQIVGEDELCAGTQAKVYKQLGTLRYRGEPMKREIVFERAKRERVVRVSQICDAPVERGRVERVRGLSAAYSHLATRGIVFFSATERTNIPNLNIVYAAQSMHAIEEIDLYDLLVSDNSLTLDQRFSLLIAAARALYREAHIHGIAHRDFKPENLRIKKSVLGYTAHLLDYNDAIKSGEVDINQVGTPDYMSEEAVACLADQPADIFALYGLAGILFCDKEQYQIWAIDSLNFQDAFNEIIAQRTKSNWDIQPSLFHGYAIFDYLSGATKAALTNLFAMMSKRKPEDRIKLMPFLNMLEHIYFAHRLEFIPRLLKGRVIKSNIIARQVCKELDNRTATMITSQDNLDKLQEYLISQLRLLPDCDVSLEEFSKITGILCLHRKTSIDGAVFQLSCVFDDMRTSFDEIGAFMIALSDLHRSLSKGAIDEQADSLADIDKLIRELNIFKAKIEKSPLDINILPDLIKHIGEKLDKVRVTLNTFLDLSVVSKPLTPGMK